MFNHSAKTTTNIDLFEYAELFEFFKDITMLNGYYDYIYNIVFEMISLGKSKNDYFALMSAFPVEETPITMAVVCAIAAEESIAEEIATPFIKLYYPEPFIASPSFVHEEL